MILTFAEIFTTYIEALLGYLILFTIFNYNKKYWVSCCTALINTIVIYAINTMQFFSYIPVVFAVTVTAFFVSFFTGRKYFSAMTLSAVYSAMVHLLDFLWLSIWCLVIGNIDETIKLVTGTTTQRLWFILSIKGISLIIYIIFSTKLKKLNIYEKYYRYIFVIAVMVYFFDAIAVNAFLNSEYEALRVGIAVEWLWVILLFAFLIYAISRITALNAKREEYKLIEIKNKMLSENIDNISNSFCEISKNNHNFKHHLALINNYIECKDYAKASEYIKTLVSTYVTPINNKYTGIEALDIILNYKRHQAEKSGVPLEINSSLIDIAYLSINDICIIFSNAIDNAIEACGETDNGYIFINISRNNNVVIFQIENPTIHNISPNIIPKSVKKGKNHGWGMKSIIMAVEKNNGVVDWKVDKGVFILTITFFIEN